MPSTWSRPTVGVPSSYQLMSMALSLEIERSKYDMEVIQAMYGLKKRIATSLIEIHDARTEFDELCKKSGIMETRACKGSFQQGRYVPFISQSTVVQHLCNVLGSDDGYCNEVVDSSAPTSDLMDGNKLVVDSPAPTSNTKEHGSEEFTDGDGDVVAASSAPTSDLIDGNDLVVNSPAPISNTKDHGSGELTLQICGDGMKRPLKRKKPANRESHSASPPVKRKKRRCATVSYRPPEEFVPLSGGKLDNVVVGMVYGKVKVVETEIDGESCLGLIANERIKRGERIADIASGFAVEYTGSVPLEERSPDYKRDCLHKVAQFNGFDLKTVPSFKSYIFREHEENDITCVYVMCSSKYVVANVANCRYSLQAQGNVQFGWRGEDDGYVALYATKSIRKGSRVVLSSYDKSEYAYDQERYAFWS